MDASIQVTEISPTRGAAWLAEAFRLFRGAPLAWIGLCAGWISITFALLLVPFIGLVIASFLQPVFFASFAIAAFKQSAGEKLAMGDLFEAFRRNMRPLVNLGALMLLAEVAIVALMAMLGLTVTTPEGAAPTIAEYAEQFKGKEWMLASAFLLSAAVKAALWFAPALIAFHGMTTMHAIRWSVYAALANFGAMVLYGFTLFVLFFLGLVAWGLGLIVVIPMMAISTYVGYREVFEPKT